LRALYVTVFQQVAHLDAGGVFVGYFFDDRQAQSRAFRFGGHIGLKRSLEDVGRKARTRIGHGQPNALPSGTPFGAHLNAG
jgi:hypothetical protein